MVSQAVALPLTVACFRRSAAQSGRRSRARAGASSISSTRPIAADASLSGLLSTIEDQSEQFPPIVNRPTRNSLIASRRERLPGFVDSSLEVLGHLNNYEAAYSMSSSALKDDTRGLSACERRNGHS